MADRAGRHKTGDMSQAQSMDAKSLVGNPQMTEGRLPPGHHTYGKYYGNRSRPSTAIYLERPPADFRSNLHSRQFSTRPASARWKTWSGELPDTKHDRDEARS